MAASPRGYAGAGARYLAAERAEAESSDAGEADPLICHPVVCLWLNVGDAAPALRLALSLEDAALMRHDLGRALDDDDPRRADLDGEQ